MFGDDEPEADLAPEQPDTAFVLRIEGYEADRFADAIVTKIARERHRQIEEMLSRKIELAVETIVNDVVREKFADAAEQILRDGFQQTDSYGRPAGPPQTIRTMILDFLNPKSNYGRPLPEIVSTVVRTRFEKEIDDAVKTLRAQVQTHIGERLNKALRDALGVKV